MADTIDIDLDALHKVRIEAAPYRTIRFGGEVFRIPAEFLYPWHEAYSTEDAVQAARAILGEDFDRLVALGPSDEDLKALVLAVAHLYGYDVGEASASNGYSGPSGSRSRPTSDASTSSTSSKRSGAKGRSVSAASART